MTRRAAIYTRISHDRRDDGLGVARQEKDCRALAVVKGWDVVDVYEDNDVSATTGKPRPSYERMVRDIEAGAIDAVLVWDVDRLTRHPRDLDFWIDFANERGLALGSVGGEIDLASIQGEAMVRIKGVFARMEAQQISRRSRAKHAELAAKGLPNGGGSRPYGFEEDRITHRPDEAEVIREAVSMLLNGASLRATCRALNQRGSLTTTGRLWATGTLKKMVVGPRVAGYRQHHGELIEAVWKPIVDRDTWERLHRELNVDRPKGEVIHQRKHTWTGLLRCWRCDGLLGARMVNGKMSYGCRSSHHDRWDASRNGGCQGTSIRKVMTDSLLDDLLLTAVEEEELGAAEADPLEPLQVAVAELEARLDALAEEFADGLRDPAAYRVASQKVTARLDEARRTLRFESARARAKTDLDPRTVRAAWPSLPPMDKRALASAMISRVVVGPARRGDNRFDPARLTVHWR